MKGHIGSVHEGKKPSNVKCVPEISEKQKLKNHIASVHEGKKPYICNICGRGFLRNGDMKGQIASDS